MTGDTQDKTWVFHVILSQTLSRLVVIDYREAVDGPEMGF
jgi:hypothetical protein